MNKKDKELLEKLEMNSDEIEQYLIKLLDTWKEKLDMQEDYINFLESQNLELKQRLEDLE